MSEDQNVNVKPLQDPGEVPLNLHNLIEASAGTGKTYTLQNLVLRMLEEHDDIGLENILIVTFTEKATSEMRERIRAQIKQRIQEVQTLHSKHQNSLIKRLKRELHRFDQASITTIHGFCNKVLKQYAFYMNQDAQFEITQNRDLYLNTLRDLLRKEGSGENKAVLKYLENLNAMTRNFMSDSSKWEETIIEVARDCPFVDDRFHQQTLPVVFPELSSAEQQYNQNQKACQHALKDLQSTLQSETSQVKDWLTQFKELPLKKKAHTDGVTLFEALLSFFNSSQPLSDLLNLLSEKPFKKYLKKSFSTLISNDQWRVNQYDQTLAAPFQHLMDQLDQLVLTHLECQKHKPQDIFSVQILKKLSHQVELIKTENQILHFNDLLKKVFQALHGNNESSEHILDGLRQKYRFALVDEFQDTDALQWGIFKKIFLQGEHMSRLNLIGDPKQSIYRFRNADPLTYHLAKKTLRQHPNGNHQVLYLQTNWRSSPELISVFNSFFTMWFSRNPEIIKTNVVPPENHLKSIQHSSDRCALNIVELNDVQEEASNDILTLRYCRFITDEIQDLLRRSPPVQIQNDQETRELNASDICILVRERSVLKLLEKECRRKQIPYAHYKRPGLFASEEARMLLNVLEAIAHPEKESYIRKMLLTDIFSCSPEKLLSGQDLHELNSFHELFEKWTHLSINRKWEELAVSILQESGFLFHIYKRKKDQLQRVYSNLQQIFNILIFEESDPGFNIFEIKERLAHLIHESEHRQNDDEVYPLSSDANSIKIMTLHASKGLQFPIVFLVMFHKNNRRYISGCLKYHEHDQLVYNLESNPAPAKKELHYQEEDAETERMAYVGMTRAIVRLYVPLHRFSAKKSTVNGDFCKILHSLSTSADSNKVGICSLPWNQHKSKRIKPTQEIKRDDIISLPLASYEPEGLSTPLYFRRRSQVSYSSLVEPGLKNQNFEIVLPEHLSNHSIMEWDESNNSPVSSTSVELDDNLPYGKNIGNAFHNIFEEFHWAEEDFYPTFEDCIQKSTLLELTKIMLQKHQCPDEENVIQHTAKTVYLTLKTPLPLANGAKPLSHVKLIKRHEMEFQLDYSTVQKKPAILKGYIDLVFQQNDIYYILDWKSNVLPDYTSTHMEACMNQHNYHLQYQLYSLALEQHLNTIYNDETYFKRHFGGVFYLFIRGMNGVQANEGVYHVSAPDIIHSPMYTKIRRPVES